MKIFYIILIFLGLLFVGNKVYTQVVPPPVTEQQLEDITNREEMETEDDSQLQQLEYYRRFPLNLNMATSEALLLLGILSDIQINSLLAYKKLLGDFLSVYELQAVPYWDTELIKRLLPYIKVAPSYYVKDDFRKRIREGEHSLLLRASQVLEKSKAYTGVGTQYLGSPQRLFFRYRYTYKNLLQLGILGDKDAGEPFFANQQKAGFDFYSYNLFARDIGIVKALALGDFAINMGQGLIQWQSLAFSKSVGVAGVKRQSATLRPYNSAGEYNFHRGLGVTIGKKSIEATTFVSYRKLSANTISDSADEVYFSSFKMNGYHRTPSEIEDRNSLSQLTWGGTVKYKKRNGYIAVNTIHYSFGLPLQKRDQPYNYFAIAGKKWMNTSVDAGYTHKNIHFFGEMAIDKVGNKAMLGGAMISVDSRLDMSMLYRNIATGYQAINGNAFTENTQPSNERGFFIGANFRPYNGWRIDAFADFYHFPWIKYLTDAPSRGRDYTVQVSYKPDKKLDTYLRYRNEAKERNVSDNQTVFNFLEPVNRKNVRIHLSYKISPTLTFRKRAEISWVKQHEKKENGYLLYADIMYQPSFSRISLTSRIQYFETDSYFSRLYAYENDVLYAYSIPVFYDKGYRYYFLTKVAITAKVDCWLRWAQVIYSDKDKIGTGTDEINGNIRSELRLQVRILF